MKNYIQNLEEETVQNTDYRRVIFTGNNVQLVLMSIKPGENIPKEVHDDVDQFIRIEAGEGKAILDGKEYALHDDSAIIIPQGTEHEIQNVSETETLKLYSIYTPPEHPDATVHTTFAEALEAEKHHHS